MVGRDVRHHRHLRGLAHADKLEAGKLHHGYIRGRDGVHHRQQRAAQVAAQMHGVPRRLQYFCNERRGGSLAVGARHGHDLAGTKPEEQLHLAGHLGARLPGGHQLRRIVFKARRAHDHLLSRQPVEVMLSQRKPDVQLAQRLGIRAKGVDVRLFVAQRDLRAAPCEQLNALLVRDARADERNAPAAQRTVKILDLFLHCPTSFA